MSKTEVTPRAGGTASTAHPEPATVAYLQSVDHPSAWRGDALRVEDIAVALEPTHIEALDAALQRVKRAGLGIDRIDRDAFALPAMAGLLDRIYREIVDGRGMVLLRGFPVDAYPMEDLEILYWGLGTHLGTGVSQSVMGDRIGHVTDVSGKDPNERAYRNSLEIPLHTDAADIVGMLSIRAAKAGGLSTYASAVTVHNEILRTRPDLLEPLYRGYRVHRFGEQPPGEPAVTPYRVPVLCERNGLVSARIVPEYIDMAEVELGEPLPARDREALNLFLSTAAREDLRFDITLGPGDVSFINNYTVLHSRTAFYDHDAPDRRRHLLRLWLTAWDRRPLSDALARDEHQGITAQHRRDSTYFEGATARVANRGRYGEQ